MSIAQQTAGRTPPPEARRDAIHIAVIPLVAHGHVWPRSRIWINERGQAVSRSYNGTPPVGIVDPFREEMIPHGERFWLYLYPNTITDLRHHWTHPAFAANDEAIAVQADAENWMRRFAEAHEVSYEELMEMIGNYVMTGTRGHFGVDIDYDSIQSMWTHYHTLTGINVDTARTQGAPFSCSC